MTMAENGQGRSAYRSSMLLCAGVLYFQAWQMNHECCTKHVDRLHVALSQACGMLMGVSQW